MTEAGYSNIALVSAKLERRLIINMDQTALCPTSTKLVLCFGCIPSNIKSSHEIYKYGNVKK